MHFCKDMASLTLRLFLDLITSTPIPILSSSRYAILDPKKYGGSKNSLLFALVGGLNDKLQLPINGEVLMGEETHFILDSTLSSNFLLVRESQYCEKSREGTSRVDIVDISDNSNVNECDDHGDEDTSKI